MNRVYSIVLSLVNACMTDNEQIMALYATTVFKLAQPVALPNSFAIITAHNPQGVIVDARTNRGYNLALHNLLAARHDVTQLLPITGCAPDMSHQEASFLVALPKATAMTIAKQFQQNAIFWVEGDQLTIVPVVLKGVVATHIGSFKARLV
jgi:hypothetical protein